MILATFREMPGGGGRRGGGGGPPPGGGGKRGGKKNIRGFRLRISSPYRLLSQRVVLD